MKTEVRIPGPSCVEKRIRLKIVPESEPLSDFGTNAVVFNSPEVGSDIIDRDLCGGAGTFLWINTSGGLIS
jgi:hypothetical protein